MKSNLNAEIESEKLKIEAKKLLNSLLKIPDGHSNGTAERLVDCIIGSAILQIAHLQSYSIWRDE